MSKSHGRLHRRLPGLAAGPVSPGYEAIWDRVLDEVRVARAPEQIHCGSLAFTQNHAIAAAIRGRVPDVGVATDLASLLDGLSRIHVLASISVCGHAGELYAHEILALGSARGPGARMLWLSLDAQPRLPLVEVTGRPPPALIDVEIAGELQTPERTADRVALTHDAGMRERRWEAALAPRFCAEHRLTGLGAVYATLFFHALRREAAARIAGHRKACALADYWNKQGLLRSGIRNLSELRALVGSRIDREALGGGVGV
ncbi:MAG: hypothetical protein K8H88_16275 [Sandaracinaceae bacterium]|nr:hypothetical protein [Sandaracinaceae bacterium]